jgi:ADP-heptose:LPS heptosyltransferase
VLLVRPDHVGDVLLSSAAVALIRASLPTARITYLVGPWSAETARHGPAVDVLRTLRFPGFTRAGSRNKAQPYALLARWAMRLRQEHYDLAVMLRGDHWWGALLALAAGIPLRVGGLAPHKTGDLLTHGRAAGRAEHWAEQALGIAMLAIEACGARAVEADRRIVFNLSKKARDEALAWLRQNHLNGERVVAIHPNAGAALKSWPIERWAAVADGLDQPVVLTGAPGDEGLLQGIAQRASRALTIACGQSIATSAALYERCAVLVATDSGAAHLAGAMGTPTVRLYGPASTNVYGPWPASADQIALSEQGLACVPCGHMVDPPCGARDLPACMLAHSAEDVIRATKSVLARTEN